MWGPFLPPLLTPWEAGERGSSKNPSPVPHRAVPLQGLLFVWGGVLAP